MKSKIAIATFFLALVAIELNNPADVLARSESENVNPLEIQEPDPLLPKRSTERPLSPLETYRLRKEISKLEERAKIEYLAGREDEAFIIWYRVLRLTRELGRLEEIKKLGEIGAIAWEESRKNDVKIISQRLQNIDSEITLAEEKEGTIAVTLGQAYQQIKAIDPALATYQKILADAGEEKDEATKINTLKILGQQYLAKFDYLKAATIYKELLDISRQKEDKSNQIIYLTKLAEIYDRAALPQNAIPIKEELTEEYLAEKKLNSIIELKISLGSNYEAIESPEKASNNYKQAFQIAWSLQELASASTALEKLAKLYLDYNQPDAAIEIYRQLIIVQQKAANAYSVMNTYDRIGQIYLEQENYIEAINSFKKGQEIAVYLQHQEQYFLDRLKAAREQIANRDDFVPKK